jgi:hypothetical protein
MYQIFLLTWSCHFHRLPFYIQFEVKHGQPLLRIKSILSQDGSVKRVFGDVISLSKNGQEGFVAMRLTSIISRTEKYVNKRTR